MAYLLDFHLLAQVIVYFASVIAGMVVVIPMIKLDNACLLFADVLWTEPGNQNVRTYEIDEPSRKNCSVPLGVCSCTVIVSFLFGILHVKAMTMRDPNTGANMRTGLYTSANAVATFLVFVSALLVNMGFSKFCENFADNPYGFSCTDIRTIVTPDKIVDFKVYEWLLVAEIACWVFFGVLLIQIALGLARMYSKPPTSPEVGDTLSVFAISADSTV